MLVIANRTIDSPELRDALLARATRGLIDVTLLAPSSHEPGSESDARTATAQRLTDAVQSLRDSGLTVEGVQGDRDPMLALDEMWNPRKFDEVIVVTLPEAASRWLAADLPRRVERLTGVPVTHVVAKTRRGVSA
ncbi:MAG: hypothetical protein ACR2LK_00525 [Solirubrobacteraceae bacterium]